MKVREVLESAHLGRLKAFCIVLVISSVILYSIPKEKHIYSLLMLAVIGIITLVLVLDFERSQKSNPKGIEVKRKEQNVTTELDNKRMTNRKATIILAIIIVAFFLCVSVLAFVIIWNIVSSLLAGHLSDPVALLSLGSLGGGVM